MTAMTLPAKPWTNGMLTADQRYQYDSTVGVEGAWRANPVPAGGLPAGSIIQWASNTIPANWLLCDGSAVSRTVYPSLFAAIGTQYGVGDGSTTFNLPDLRGRVAVGKNGGTFGTLGATGGAETHTLSVNEMPSHTHVQNAHTHIQDSHSHSIGLSHWAKETFAWDGRIAGSRYWEGGGNYSVGSAGATATNQNTTATNQNTGGGQAHNNLQPYLVTNYIIKATIGVTAGDSQLATRVGVLEQNPSITGTLTVAGTATFNSRVLAPNQPAFSATANYGTNYSGSLATVVYQTVDVNNGNHYSTSTGRFTAPVSGTYFFSAQAHRNGQTGYTTLRLRKNGVLFSNSWSTGGSGSASDGMTASGLTYLSANDYVYVEMETSQTNYIAENYWKFMGHLVG